MIKPHLIFTYLLGCLQTERWRSRRPPGLKRDRWKLMMPLNHKATQRKQNGALWACTTSVILRAFTAFMCSASLFLYAALGEVITLNNDPEWIKTRDNLMKGQFLYVLSHLGQLGSTSALIIDNMYCVYCSSYVVKVYLHCFKSKIYINLAKMPSRDMFMS